MTEYECACCGKKNEIRIMREGSHPADRKLVCRYCDSTLWNILRDKK